MNPSPHATLQSNQSNNAPDLVCPWTDTWQGFSLYLAPNYLLLILTMRHAPYTQDKVACLLCGVNGLLAFILCNVLESWT